MPLARILGLPGHARHLLYKPEHSLIDQSLHSKMGAETTNGDGFGVGWYGDRRHARRLPQRRARLERPQPARYGAAHRVAARVRPHPRVDRHGRAADELPPLPARTLALDAQRLIRDFHEVKRDLVLAVDPSLYPSIEGSTDTEVFFHLALSFGLEDDPPAAVEARGRADRGGRPEARRRAPDPDDGRDDGRRDVWAFRYSSERDSRSLFYSTDVPTLRELHPELEILRWCPTSRG